MSQKGGQNGRKHGGAHGSTHVSPVPLKNNRVEQQICDKTVFISIEGSVNQSSDIQDGGQNGGITKTASTTSDTEEIGALLASDPENVIIHDDLDNFEGEVNETSAEWLKTRCRTVETIDDYVVPDSVHHGCPSSTLTLPMDVLAKGMLEKAKDIGEIFDSDNDDQETTANAVSTLTMSIPTSSGVLKTVTVSLPASVANSIMTSNLQSAVSAIETTPVLHLPETTVISDGGALSKTGNRSNSSSTSGLSSQDQACLEELERGSQLSQEERELIENSRKELHDLVELRTLETDRSNTLMTPQELESMPERGIEFEESVGPKPQENPSDESIEDMEVTDGFENLVSGVSLLPENLLPSGMSNLNNTIILSQVGGIPSETSEGTVTELTETVPASDNAVSEPGVATISISTDQESNSTQILINTNMGQQIYQINTADLSQATAAMQPMALQNGLISADKQGNKNDGSLGKLVPVQDTSAATSENGQLSVPAYLLIPVDQKYPHNGSIVLTGQDGSGNAVLVNQAAEKSQKVWMCSEEGCSKQFTKPSKLKVHLMKHRGERPFKCSFPGCDWAFTTGYKCKRHEESHEKKKEWECDIDGCGKKFTTIYNLNSHKKLHDRSCLELCPQPGCGAKFPTKRKLDLHMKDHPEVAKTYKCPIEGCAKTFYSPMCMGSHARVHQQTRDLRCKFEGCGKVFDKLCRLKQHMRSHTGERPYICNEDGCGWAFATASKLKRHVRKHTGERKWTCPIEDCGKAFMRAEHLKGHMVVHSGDRPFECPEEGCTAKFTAKSSMYVHIKKHQQSPKKIWYHCPLEGCSKKFGNKTGLRNHIVRHYNTALATCSDLEITPLFQAEGALEEGTLESISAGQPDGTSAAVAALTNVANAMLPQDDTTIIDPADYIVTSDQPILNAASYSDVMTQQVSNNVVTQLIVADQLGQASASAAAVSSLGKGNNLSLAATTTTTASEPIMTAQTPNKIAIVPDNETPVSPDASSGSARTDYRSNHLLSDQAKKRRRLMKEKGIVGLVSLQDVDSLINLNTSSIASKTSDSVLGSAATSTSSSSSSSSSSSTTSTSVVQSFSPPNMLTSRGITFRDPDTGATYVQTQLLQDDPPSPEIFHEAISLPTSAPHDTPLTGSLGVTILHETQSNDGSEAGTATANEFTGTTINLQDLE